MPTDIRLSVEERRIARQKEAADLRAYLLLIPLIFCLFTVILCMESNAFEAAITHMATPTDF